jgi:hypothetical protein
MTKPAETSHEDFAAKAGRLTGQLTSKLGVRLLRTRPLREAVRRGYEEVQEPGPDKTPNKTSSKSEEQ